MKKTIASLISSTLLVGCSVVGVRSGTEEPPFEVIGTINNDIELRLYGERLAAEVSMDQSRAGGSENSAFSMLAGYIFGGNRTDTRVAMTAPVAIKLPSETKSMSTSVGRRQNDGSYTMRFFLPESYSIDTAPIPMNEKIKLVTIPSETIAAIRFSGWRNQEAVSKHKKLLMQTLEASNWQAMSDPFTFAYDPPWTAPFLRRNEVAVVISQR
ncbi:MAG: SOUL family heme-binding protein [Rhodospirillaceae bacterium]